MPSDIGRGDVTASEIDQLVGDRIRQRRILMGLTQDQLGAALGISYQQVQKYETGANRVSAGRLYLIARRLDVNPGWFFDPMATGLNGLNLGDSNSSRNLIEFVRHFGRIDDDRLRSTLLNLVRVLSEYDSASTPAGDVAESGSAPRSS